MKLIGMNHGIELTLAPGVLLWWLWLGAIALFVVSLVMLVVLAWRRRGGPREGEDPARRAAAHQHHLMIQATRQDKRPWRGHDGRP